MSSSMDGPTAYNLAHPFAIVMMAAAALAGCAWLVVAASLRKTGVAALQTRPFASRLEIAALLTGISLMGAAVHFFLA